MRRLSGPVVALITVTVCLCVFEGALRVVGFDPFGDLLNGRELILRESDHPRLRYELTPNTEGWAWRTQVHVNSAGFRDAEYSEAKGERYRVVVIGDSITFGNDLPADRRFTEVAETRLNASHAHPGVDILNLGVGGYDTAMEVASLESIGLRYAPDLVVVAFCVNDISDNSPNAGYIRSLRAIHSPIYRLRTAQLVRVAWDRARFRWDHSVRNADAEIVLSGTAAPANEARARLVRELAEHAQEKIEPGSEQPLVWYRSEKRLWKILRALERLSGLAHEHDFGVLVAIIPYLANEPDYREVYDLITQLARSLGFDVLRLDDLFAGDRVSALRIRPEDPIHPNVEGHEIIADALSREILSRINDAKGGRKRPRADASARGGFGFATNR
jgi:lysophospholipase L1-like esterase